MSETTRKTTNGVTLVELGRMLNLSPRAVSQVLNGGQTPSTVRVNPKTRERVEKLAKKLGYRPNRAAQAFRTGKNRGLIGIFTSQSFESIWAQRMYFARLHSEHNGFTLLPFLGYGSDKARNRAVDFFLDYRVEAVVLFLHLERPHLQRLLDAGIKVITIIAGQPLKVPGYFVDRVGGFKLLTQHLIEQGHSKITLVHGSTKEHSSEFAAMAEEGFAHAMADARRQGLTVYPDIRRINTKLNGFMSEDYPNIHGLHAPGYIAMKEMIASGNIPDACIGVIDETAQGILGACSEAGDDLIHRVAVAGFTNSPWSTTGILPITSILEPFDELCKRAFTELKSFLENGVEIPEENVEMPCKVLVRASTNWKRSERFENKVANPPSH